MFSWKISWWKKVDKKGKNFLSYLIYNIVSLWKLAGKREPLSSLENRQLFGMILNKSICSSLDPG